MKHSIHRFYLLILSLLFLSGCGVPKNAGSTEMKTMENPTLNYGTKVSTPALVYKTRADYYNRVPVLMNTEKNRILSYPDPTDLNYGNKLALPTKLKNGYLLDNRGIGINVAFLTYTYETYAALTKVPDMTQLMDSILDKKPLSELWDCGSRSLYKNEVDELNTLIDKGFPNGKALMEVMHVTR